MTCKSQHKRSPQNVHKQNSTWHHRDITNFNSLPPPLPCHRGNEGILGAVELGLGQGWEEEEAAAALGYVLPATLSPGAQMCLQAGG